jgi:predicted Zn-dependent peptidase
MVLGLILLALSCTPASALGPDAGIQLDVQEFRLENGMLFLVVERPVAPQVACRLAIRAGSALEEAGKTGIAHLLEHVMFNGTKNFGTLDPERDAALQKKIEAAYQVILAEEAKRKPDRAMIERKREEMAALRREVQEIYVPQAFSSQLGRNGAVGVNAFTSTDQTQYLASVPSDMLEQWFSIISEQLFEPAWREFYVEKEVVQREWAFRYINSPEGAAWLDLHATAYRAHPYRNPVIGWKSDMGTYNTRDAMTFHERYYNPTNSVCVLVGDVTLRQARRLAEAYFGRYPAGREAPERVTQEPPQMGARKSVRFLKGARKPIVRLGFHGARMGTEDFYALDALTMVLSHGRSARMNQNIVEKGHALRAWAANPDNRYGGMVILGGSPHEPEGLKEPDLSEDRRRRIYLEACERLEGVLLSEIDRLVREGVSERELKRIKKLNQKEFLERMRSNERLAGTLASLEVQVGWRYLLTYLERLAGVTPEAIGRVAGRYLRPDRRTSVFVIPGGQAEEPAEPYSEVRNVTGAAAARMAKTDASVNHSIYPTPDGWKHPLSFRRHPEKVTYPKAERAEIAGATLFYLPDRTLPLVDLTLLVKAGAVDVDFSRTGLPQVITAALIRGGTEQHPSSELARVLDEHAVDLSFSVGEEATVIELSVMKEDWERGLALLKEVLTRPALDPKVLRVVKQQALAALARQGGDARAVSRREAKIWHFQGHPYGRDPLQGLETIPNLTPRDLLGFLRTYVVPSNMVAAVAGDIDQAEAIRGLKGLFQSLPGDPAPERKMEDPPETPKVLALIHKPGQVQSQVNLRLRSLKRTHPDYWNVSLLASILGGSESLMSQRLRSDLGLVYATWLYQTYQWKAGYLYGYIGCRADRTGAAIRETVEIMRALNQRVPEEELEQKRLDALNSFVFNVDTPKALAEAYARYHMREEPLDTLERIQEAYLTAEGRQLEALARRFLDPEHLQVFVVADKATPVIREDGQSVSLEEELKAVARALGLPFQEIPLR